MAKKKVLSDYAPQRTLILFDLNSTVPGVPVLHAHHSHRHSHGTHGYCNIVDILI